MIPATPRSVPSAEAGGTMAVAGAVDVRRRRHGRNRRQRRTLHRRRRLGANETLKRRNRRQIPEQLAESDFDVEAALNLLRDLTEQQRVEPKLEEGCG